MSSFLAPPIGNPTKILEDGILSATNTNAKDNLNLIQLCRKLDVS